MDGVAVGLGSRAVAARAWLATGLAVVLAASLVVPTTAQSGAPPDPAAEPATSLVFQSVELPNLAGLEQASVRTVAEGDGLLVALAECPDERCTRVLRSTDGLEWDLADDTLPGWTSGVVWTEDGFLVAQNDNRRLRQVLYRSDDGLDWEEIPLRDAVDVEGMAAGPDGYLLYGCDRDCERSVIWWSADGRSWSRDTAFGRRSRLTDSATSGGTLVAISDGFVWSGGRKAVAFADGRWVDLDLPLPTARSGEYFDIYDVTARPDGAFSILGEHGTPASGGRVEPFLLVSPDGLTWEYADVPLEFTGLRIWASPTSIASGAELTAIEVILSGREAKTRGIDDTFRVVWSAGEQDWQAAALPTPPGSEAFLWDLHVTDDGRVIAVGHTEGDGRLQPAIWVGSLEASAGAESLGAGTELREPDLVTPGRGRRAQEQELLDRAGYATCSPYRGQGDFDPFDFGATAGVQCDRPVDGIEQLAAFQFPDAGSMEGYWRYRIDPIAASLPRNGGGCPEGEQGLAAWEHGSVACYDSRDGRAAHVRWTDERTNTYWLADADHRDVARLARWWRDRGP